MKIINPADLMAMQQGINKLKGLVKQEVEDKFWEERYDPRFDAPTVKVVLDPNWDRLDVKPFIKGSDDAAAYDIRSLEDTIILPGQTLKVYTGVKLDMPKGIYLELFSRSGCTLNGLVVANGVGVIDSDYKGYIFLILHNRSIEEARIHKGDRVAQGIFKQSIDVKLDMVSVVDYNMTQSARGESGFGSSGVK
jgi:dUTP pyrophosphatase